MKFQMFTVSFRIHVQKIRPDCEHQDPYFLISTDSESPSNHLILDSAPFNYGKSEILWGESTE